MVKIGFVSLGCSKNLVDTEMMIGLFKKHRFDIVANPEDADIIIVNTCGFIDSAKKEAIDTLLEMAEYKANNCKLLVATGCLVQRYKDDLIKELPEVDLFISLDEYDDLYAKVEELIKNKTQFGDNQYKLSKQDYNLSYFDREISTNGYYAYLKIAEGCSNNCTYCAIPKIRGPYISRPMEDILKEAQELSDKGLEELIVIAQDTTKYGVDLYKEQKLPELLRKLCKMNFKWIRFLYAYPESITDELINVVKEEEKIVNYFDMPIQHISDNVLKRMARKTTGKHIKEIISKIRKEIPNVVLRTTLIAGFPGETEDEFNELKEFVKEAKFDRLGCFAYSKEEGTPAVKLDGHLPTRIKKQRANEIMKIQKKVSKDNNKELIGREFEVLLENITEDGKYYVGRSYREVPEDTDGVIYVENSKELIIGDFVKVEITDAMDYDLIARIT
ncbi:MAG: 30S ribosomal protein S12 methylthiotransferase RimO [Clostridia bacterium]|nr:30S ribosomal protein S12 methylthiotransferase RimO [Clostridia bacterium]